jgi:hypothetical protein
MSPVEYARNNQIATLSLNRPDRLNALSDELVPCHQARYGRVEIQKSAMTAVPGAGIGVGVGTQMKGCGYSLPLQRPTGCLLCRYSNSLKSIR